MKSEHSGKVYDESAYTIEFALVHCLEYNLILVVKLWVPLSSVVPPLSSSTVAGNTRHYVWERQWQAARYPHGKEASC